MDHHRIQNTLVNCAHELAVAAPVGVGARALITKGFDGREARTEIVLGVVGGGLDLAVEVLVRGRDTDIAAYSHGQVYAIFNPGCYGQPVQERS